MARLESQYKAGFYATPPTEVARACGLLSAPRFATVRVLDPCAGEGDAVEAIATHLAQTFNTKSEIYATEVSKERWETHARKARTFRPCFLNTDWKDMVVANGGVGFLWLNPPYDWGDEARDDNTHKKARLEYIFLRDTLSKLQDGGVLVYIVPEKVFALPYVRSFLSENLSHITAYRFAADTYAAFKQIVLIGRRHPRVMSPDTEKLLEAWANGGVPEYDSIALETYTIPLPDKPGMLFRRNNMADTDLIEMVIASGGAHATRKWLDVTTPPEVDFTPLVAPRTGHAATLLASGMMGVLRIGDKLIKGKTTQALAYYDKQGLPLGEDADKSKVARTVTTFSSRVDEVDTITGAFQVHQNAKDLEKLFQAHAGTLTDAIFARYKPLYDGHINGQGPVLAKLIPHKKLPGQKKAGLLPLQKQLAVAAEKSCRKYGMAIVVGEMGLGKSAVGLATTEILNAYPAIIIAPAHLAPKWVRECQDVIPGCHAVEGTCISDIDAFMRSYGDPARKGILILSKEKAKLGPGWTATDGKRTIVTREKFYSHEFDRTMWKTTREKLVVCPHCGASTGLGKLSASRKLFCNKCKQPLYQYGRLTVQKVTARQTPARPNAITLNNAVVATHKWPLARYIKQRGYQFGMCIGDELHKYKGKSTDQGRAFHNLAAQSKYTVGLTGTLFGGKASDLFFLLYRMFPRTLKAEGFDFAHESSFVDKYGRLEAIYATPDDENASSGKTTGMLRAPLDVREIPGISPGIYRHVLPFCIFAKIDDLGVSMPAFTEKIHRLDMDANQDAQYRASTAILHDHIKDGMSSFDKQGMREARALMGAYLQYALSRPNSAFRREEFWWKPIEGEPHKPYWVHRGALPTMPTAGAIDDSARFGDESLADLEAESRTTPEADADAKPATQPAAPRCPNDARDLSRFQPPPGMEAMVLQPAITFADMLPKEKWLVETVKKQVSRQRRTIVYVRQTGTRNIQPRLQTILEREGITCAILPDGDPRKREEWISKNHAQVLLTNPIKVETGLDLIQFQSIVFYEMTYSLFTFWQALRRVWRLGQTQPVEVYYCVYSETMEEQALALMGHKLRAAHLLYGDSAMTEVSAAVDGTDFMAELAQSILKKQHITTDGITGLVGDRSATDNQPSKGPEADGAAGTDDDATAADDDATIAGTCTVGEIVAPLQLATQEQPMPEPQTAVPLYDPDTRSFHFGPTRADKPCDNTLSKVQPEDFRHLLDLFGAREDFFLLGGNDFGLPSIQDMPCSLTDHKGYGCFTTRNRNVELWWNGGGGMNHTGSDDRKGISYTPLSIHRSDGAQYIQIDWDGMLSRITQLYAWCAACHAGQTQPAAEPRPEPITTSLDFAKIVKLDNRYWQIKQMYVDGRLELEAAEAFNDNPQSYAVDHEQLLADLNAQDPMLQYDYSQNLLESVRMWKEQSQARISNAKAQPRAKLTPADFVRVGDTFTFNGFTCTVQSIDADGLTHTTFQSPSPIPGQHFTLPLDYTVDMIRAATGKSPLLPDSVYRHAGDSDETPWESVEAIIAAEEDIAEEAAWEAECAAQTTSTPITDEEPEPPNIIDFGTTILVNRSACKLDFVTPRGELAFAQVNNPNAILRTVSEALGDANAAREKKGLPADSRLSDAVVQTLAKVSSEAQSHHATVPPEGTDGPIIHFGSSMRLRGQTWRLNGCTAAGMLVLEAVNGHPDAAYATDKCTATQLLTDLNRNDPKVRFIIAPAVLDQVLQCRDEHISYAWTDPTFQPVKRSSETITLDFGSQVKYLGNDWQVVGCTEKQRIKLVRPADAGNGSKVLVDFANPKALLTRLNDTTGQEVCLSEAIVDRLDTCRKTHSDYAWPGYDAAQEGPKPQPRVKPVPAITPTPELVVPADNEVKPASQLAAQPAAPAKKQLTWEEMILQQNKQLYKAPAAGKKR